MLQNVATNHQFIRIPSPAALDIAVTDAMLLMVMELNLLQRCKLFALVALIAGHVKIHLHHVLRVNVRLIVQLA